MSPSDPVAPASADEPAGPGRTISPVAGRRAGAFTGKLVTVAALVVGGGVVLASAWGPQRPRPDKAPVSPARQVVKFEPAGPAGARPTLANPGPDAPVLETPASGPQVPTLAATGAPGDPAAAGPATARQVADRRAAQLHAIRAAPIVAYAGGGGTVMRPLPAERDAEPAPEPAPAPSELDQLRRGSTIGRASARSLGDRNFLILAGTAIPCVLQTAMDSATPGYVSCLVPSDVYSDNGAVVLLEKGTKVLGEYRSGQRQGQGRLFVLWTRAVTPAGIAIALASPATDALGRAGFDGRIDSHFWDRFGAALLLSIVDDAAAASGSRGESWSGAGGGSPAAALAVQSGAGIGPSLRKAQGANVAIFAAQDFDFSAVYGLKAH